MTQPKARRLYEVSWEVCNKVGGINTVLKSKAALMHAAYKEYFLIGPYFEEHATLELSAEEPPKEFAQAFAQLEQQGIVAHYGTWQIKGAPKAILLDFRNFLHRKDDVKAELWEKFKIDSLNAGWDYDEPILFSAAVAELLNLLPHRQKHVAHFHEWMTGATILFLKNRNSPLRTTFTTHATMLGRAICGDGGALYDMLATLDPVKEAYAHGVQAKHLTEAAAAHTATIFTTVSEITAMEAEQVLGRRPEVLVLNGLDIAQFPTFEESTMKHITCRERLRDYLSFHFFPHYIFPLEHNLIYFITGRYEFRNKGIDLIIQALGKLNEQLRAEKSKRTISVFFWIPMEHAGIKVELLENKNYYHHIQHYIQANSESILKRVLHDFLSQEGVSCDTLFTQGFLKDMQQDLLQFKRKGDPTHATHYMPGEGNHEVLQAFARAGLHNCAEDKVKVVLQPFYLNGTDGLINLPYYDAIAGAHLGIFPSYYEPWGYTPLETAALGTPAITTDLAGFGRYIEPSLPKEHAGISVLHRFGIPHEKVVAQLTASLHEFSQLSHAERVQRRITAMELATACDWKDFIQYYIEAHNRALS